MVGRVFLDRYETVHLLGEGGMGCVYLARPRDEPEPVVVKVMHAHIATNPKFRERFQKETRLMARFRHPNTVAFVDASLDDPEGPCIVMEYLPGITLDKLLARNGRFSPMRLRRLLGQFCDVLQAAHDAGIIHRDLKPANLMVLDPDTPFEKLKVMDFGLAEMAEPSGDGRTGRGEAAVGTPGYMPPEQVRGEAMDHRGDLYSVGVIVYQMLTGRLPFSGGSAMEILMAQAADGPPTFASLGLDDRMPAAVEDVVRACLAPSPAQRPRNARAIAEAYEAALERVFNEPEAPPKAEPEPEQRTDAEVDHLEAYLPEQIAVYKLRGFVQEVGGKIKEIAPGRVHVRLAASQSPLRLLRFFSKWARTWGPIDMELQMEKKDPSRPNVLHVTVLLRPAGGGTLPSHPYWKKRCGKIHQALRAFLMSKS
jgi:eukaryotic-like serine/threonine-protein kinase